jgi:hypothetical protein
MSLTIQTRILNNDLQHEPYFHLKPARLSDNLIAMTMQTIKGHDYFGPVQVTYSGDKGDSWQQPQAIPALGWYELEHNMNEVVCDVVPDYHEKSGKLLAIGHNAFYSNSAFVDTFGFFNKTEKAPELQRFSVYSVRDRDGRWSVRKKISLDEFNDKMCFVCGCSQKVILPDGNIIIPSVIGEQKREDFRVVCLLCSFDGEEIKVLKRGNILENPVGRGLLEPSAVKYQGMFYLTLRAEDERGYLTTSDDGLNWAPIKPWQWDNGTPLIMSTTQQHWLKLGGKLYLIYTRKNGVNTNIMRWRAPLLIAEFDADKQCLLKATEQTVFPIRGDIEKPETVGLMGNFHPLAISDSEAIITVGEMRPQMGFSGDSLLARITI